MVGCIKKSWKRIVKLQKNFVASLLIFSLLFSQFSFLVPLVYAASSPWTQTDWSGGSGQTSWSDNTKFDSSSSVTTSTAGQATLTNTEKLSNTGFESDLTSWSEVPSYTLNDQFTTDRAAGAVNGSSAEPTGGTRTVVDTENKLSISSSQLSFAGQTTPAWGDQNLVYPSVTRTAGKLLYAEVTPANNNSYGFVGLSNTATPNQTASGIQIDGSIYFGDTGQLWGTMLSSTVTPTIASYTATAYKTAIVMRSTGMYYFIKGGAFTNWTMLYQTSAGSAATLYPVLMNYSLTNTADNIRIPTSTWLPTPLAYDTFTRTDGAIGSSETTGPDSQTTPSLAWTGGAISTNKNVITPTEESELLPDPGLEGTYSSGLNVNLQQYVGTPAESADSHGGSKAQQFTPSSIYNGVYANQTTTVGTWYLGSMWGKKTTTGGNPYMRIETSGGGTIYKQTSIPTSYTHILTAFRALSTTTQLRTTEYHASVMDTVVIDDLSIKPLTLSSLFSSVSTSDTDVIADANVTLTSGTQAGLVTNLDSTSTPANFLIAYHDGTNVKLDKNVGGTYTNLISAAATYSAGATLRVITYTSSGSLKVRVYYNNAMVGTEQTVSDAGIISNTKHGLFSTYSGNSFDNFTLWARGTGAEYTSAPFEELTVTRDTGTKYAGAASAKLVAGGTDANYLQSVNVGDTNSYNLSAYAYTDGSAVTSSDLELYYNGSTISTTYTSVGGGWYQLTGTLTGADASRDFGVRVKAGKTAYTDNFSLNRYETSGTLTSSIFDTEYGGGAVWGILTYSSSGSTVAVKARTSNSSSMTGATAFSSCTAITSGSDISSNGCVTDSHRYIQYQLSLSTSDTLATPTFNDVSIAFSAYDADAPSISLTALSPDPNTDTTPTLSGTATDAAGTVSNVQYQMDATSGSWTACSADDGSFDEATETFTCTPSALSDGSHTMYVRATDSNSNTTSSGSESSDTFTIDATTPVSIDLDSPGDNSYTNSERPTFKWKATSDATAGLSKYSVDVDNGDSGDFTVDDIPTSRTTDYETNKYIAHYENFSDSDSTNNYISVYTKSTSEWGSDNNNGKLKEGKRSWKVKARDNAGNETSSSRTLFVDRSSPKVELTQINDVPHSASSGQAFSSTDKTPTIYGKISDPRAGDKTDNYVAGGPKQVEIKVEKKEGLGYKLHTLYTINMDKPWWTCDGKEVSDNSKQTCDKYLPFEYTSKENLELGTYRITVNGKDKANNSSSGTTLTLHITTLEQITTSEEKKIIEEEIKPLAPEEKEKIKEELEITKPVESSALEKAGTQISQTSKTFFTSIGSFINNIINGIGQGLRYAFDATGKALAFVGRGIGNSANAVGQGLTRTGGKIGEGASYVVQGTGNLLASIGQEIGNTGKAIGDGYNQLANNAPGVAKTILTGIGNGVSTTANAIASATSTVASTTVTIAKNTASIIGITANSIASTRSTIAKNTGSAVDSATQYVVSNAKNRIANLAFAIGERTEDISHGVGIAIIKIGYLFVSEPTTISNVKVAKSTATTMTVTWETNHPANSKVNYGLTADYGQDVQSEKRITSHEFTVTGLEPNTTYYYEVMSHNRNYVYDANHTFTTPAE